MQIILSVPSPVRKGSSQSLCSIECSGSDLIQSLTTSFDLKSKLQSQQEEQEEEEQERQEE